MVNPLHLTLVELCAAIRSRDVSPVELMNATVARLDETHDELNAVIARRNRDDLLAEARQAEIRVQRGEARPLEGIPLGVKDLEDAAGLVTSHGSIPYRDDVAARDSIQVARLRSAGAIVLGKTNAPEFGHTAVTKNLLHGVTRSPWDRERTPGGSSGGSAAALTAEVLPLVTASDGGGSIRIPASFTGAFGFKPSHGRVPVGPSKCWDHPATTVYGPLTKTVADAALVLDQVAGPHPLDPTSLPHPGTCYAEAVEQPLGAPLAIAFSPDLGYGVVQSDVAAVVAAAARVFETLGHRIEVIEGGPPDMGLHWGILNAYELGGKIHHVLSEHASNITRSLLQIIEMARGMDLAFWGEMSRRRCELVAWCAEVFESHDLLLTPTVPFDPAPAKGPFPLETEGRPQPLASAATFTVPFNLSWHPAATVRAGLSAQGLPAGLQIVGPHHRDDVVLRAARAFERERPWHPHWPLR